MSIGQVVAKLANTNSAPEKIKILKANDSIELQDILKLTYDTRDSYGLKYPGTYLFNVISRDCGLHLEESVILEQLKNRMLTGHRARNAVERITREYNSELLKAILNRDLECGIGATTINKAFPGLIPQFKIQKAKEVHLSKVKLPVLAQLKYDGDRLVTVVKNSKVTHHTSSGKLVNLPKLRARFEANLPRLSENFVLDGELVHASGKSADRTSVSGMVNSAMHGGVINESLLRYAVFDYLSLDDFENQKCTNPYHVRLEIAEHVAKVLGEPVQIAFTVELHSVDEINEHVNKLYEKGYEGLVLKSRSHLYEFKRSAVWVKIKEIKDADLTCVEVKAGTGKFEGMIGSLTCVGTVEGQLVFVDVGSGLTDADRARDPSYYIDRTIEMKYNSVIENQITARKSLFLPRYLTLRTDK